MMDDAATARLKAYVTDSNEVLEFKLIRQEEDIENNKVTFKPEMSHQIFGDSETIFGYKDLRIKLYYSAGSLETYLGMTYSEKANKEMLEGVEPDEVLSKISEKLAPQVHDNIDSFITALHKDDTFQPHGPLVHYCTIDDDGDTRSFQVHRADMSEKGFATYNQRLQTFLLWYIDAANFVDADDDQWHYFTMFEKYTTTSGATRYGTIGFATVYQYWAWPHHTRPRIAQFLILPPFQNMGLGAHLLRGIYAEYYGRSMIKDITVEDPSANFQRLRDYVDASNCMTLPSFQKYALMEGFSNRMAIQAKEKFKINKRQARRVYEILRLRATNLSDEQEYRDYRLDVKKRLNVPFKREQHDQKKLEAALKKLKKQGNVALPPSEQRMQLLEKDYRALEEEYKRVVKRLEQ